MKWNESGLAGKVIAIIGYVSMTAFLILTLLHQLAMLSVHKAVVHALMGVFFLSQGLTEKSRKEKIWKFTLAAGWFLISVLYCF